MAKVEDEDAIAAMKAANEDLQRAVGHHRLVTTAITIQQDEELRRVRRRERS